MRHTEEEEITYTTERRFFINNTTFDIFANKLNRYTQGVSSQSFPMEKGRMILQPARKGRRPLTIEMEGLYSTVVEGAERVCRVGTVISFEAIKVSDERIEVIARCGQPAVLNYFSGELMEEIEGCWPEVREQRVAKAKTQVKTLIEEIDTELRGVEPEPAETGAGERPWERIPDHNWDRQALQLWWEGYTCPEIASRIYVASKTVLNRLSLLRQEHGDEIVPTDAQRRKKWRSGYSG